MQRAQTIGIRQRVADRQCLVLRCHALNRDLPGWQVVDVDNLCGGGATDRLRRAEVVRIVGRHRNGFSHQGLTQAESGGRGAANVYAIGLPLVADGAHAVYIH